MLPKPTETLGNTLDFMRVLWSVAHGLQSRSKRMEADLGITGPQRLVLRILGRTPGRTAGELARAMCVHPSTLTGVLRRLETRALVERRKDSADARKSLFVLTPTGRKLDGQQAGTVEAAVRRSLGRLPSHDLDTTRRVLEMLSGELARTDR